MEAESFVPALGYRWLTPAYDAVVRLTTRERAFKQALLDQAALQPGWRVLDLASGTGTLAVMAKRRTPAARIEGLDADPEVIARARARAAAANLDLRFTQGRADALPFPDAWFDAVLCSLFFHHLTRGTRLRAFAEIARVLKPGAPLHAADWGEARDPLMRFAFLGIQVLDGFKNTADNVAGKLPAQMREAGLTVVEETRRFATLFGTMSLYRAIRPARS